MIEDSYVMVVGIAIPMCLLFAGSIVLFLKEKTVCYFLQLLAAGSLVLVLLTHVAEPPHLFPWMHWGAPTQHWQLRRFLECCSWSHVFPGWIFAPCAYKGAPSNSNFICEHQNRAKTLPRDAVWSRWRVEVGE